MDMGPILGAIVALGAILGTLYTYLFKIDLGVSLSAFIFPLIY